MNSKKYFEIFIEHSDDKFALYTELKEFIATEIINARGEENAKAYKVLTDLSNSENNSGWEIRHDQRINLLNSTMSDIYSDYGLYLP